VGVTAIGYTRASRGPSDQGQARLASDAYLMASALDRRNLERLEAAPPGTQSAARDGCHRTKYVGIPKPSV
jgi:hypothetical protein